mgnify:CR=1 FL=1
MKVSREIVLLGVAVLVAIHLAQYVLAEILVPASLTLIGYETTRTAQIVWTSLFLVAGGAIVSYVVRKRDGDMRSAVVHAAIAEAIVGVVGFVTSFILQVEVLQVLLNIMYLSLIHI